MFFEHNIIAVVFALRRVLVGLPEAHVEMAEEVRKCKVELVLMLISKQ